MEWASLCMILPLMGLTKIVSTKVDSQNAHKMPNFKYPLSTENGVSFYNERHPLLKRCFQPFLKCMRQMGGASLCILLPLKGLTELLCSTKVDSQITNKMQVLGILSLSAWKIVCWTVRRDIHSIWIVSKFVLDAEGRWEKLLTVSASHLRVSSCNLPPWLTLINCTQNNRCSIPSQYKKWGAMLPGEISIARKVLKSLI